MIKKDLWLSNYFIEGGAYHYYPKKNLCYEFPCGFIDSKIHVDDYENLNHLFKNKFYVVETSLLFQQKEIIKNFKLNDKFIIRETKQSDRSQVIKIASNSFENARFYNDPNIKKETASDIKRDWVDNFYKGIRGNYMFVCEDKNGMIAGFLLLKENVIDLIATSSSYFGNGVASGLINFANKKIGKLQAGTQSTNFSSMKLYVKNMFSVVESKFTLHTHR